MGLELLVSLRGARKLPPGGAKPQLRVGFDSTPETAPPGPLAQTERGKFLSYIVENAGISSSTDLGCILLFPGLS